MIGSMRLIVASIAVITFVISAVPAPAMDGIRFAQARSGAAAAKTSGGERMPPQRQAYCEAKGLNVLPTQWPRCTSAPRDEFYRAWRCWCDATPE